jgi:hypothetical protein
LKIYHFGSGNKTQYVYHVAVMEETNDFPVMALRCYTENKPHCRMYVLADNERRMYEKAEIINMHDYRSARKKINSLQ